MIKGLKRICASCTTRFYDLGKSPIICPKCGAEFTGTVKIRARRGRGVIEADKAKAADLRESQVDDVVEEDEETSATVSLNDLEEEENVATDGDEETEESGDLDLDDLDEDGDDEEDLDDLDDDIEINEDEERS